MTKSRSICWDVVRWSIWYTDHITRSNRHDRHARQCNSREDDTIHCNLRGDNAIYYNPKGDDARQCKPVVWLGSLEF